MNSSLKAYKKLLGLPDVKNPDCDGAFCRVATGEVRILPIGEEANAHVCEACYDTEMAMRETFNEYYDAQIALPSWNFLDIVPMSEAKEKGSNQPAIGEDVLDNPFGK